MTFKKRQLAVEFSDSSGVLTLPGLRVIAIITNPGGYVAFSQAEVRIFGMSPDHMRQFSSFSPSMIAVQNKGMRILAGNEGEKLTEVFAGNLIRSAPEFSGAPDVVFSCRGVSGMFAKTQAIASQSFPGDKDAAEIIDGIAKICGLSVQNNGAHAMLRNQASYGSGVDQILTIAKAAQFQVSFEGGVVSLWPKDKPRDDVIVEVSKDNGLIGYPTMWQAGWQIKTEFNPEIKNGRTVRLKSMWQPACGDWQSLTVTHELSSQAVGGGWFTTTQLMPRPQ